MKKEVNENYTLLTPRNETVKEIIEFLNQKFDTSKKEHIVINFSENFNINSEEIKLFLDVATLFKKNGISFVLIISNINFDTIPDELNVAPTLTEAVDILEIDAIERDLMNL